MLSPVVQVTYFSLGAHGSLGCLATLSSITQLPSVVTGAQIIWVSLVLIPLLALPLLSSEPDEEIMHMISPKNEAASRITTCGGTASLRRLVNYFLIRFVPTSVVCCVLYALCLRDVTGLSLKDVLDPNILIQPSWVATSNELDFDQMEVLACPRAAALWFFTLYITIHAANFVHRAEGWWAVPLNQRNQLWCGCAALALVLQSVFTVVALVIHGRLGDISQLSWSTWVLGLTWPIFLYLLDTMVAKKDDGDRGYGRQTDDFGRELWLDFNTKLGMHSPV